MERTNRPTKTILAALICAAAMLALSCESVVFDHPLDAKSPNYSPKYHLTVSADNNGTVNSSVSNGLRRVGSSVSVTAMPANSAYTFDKWTAVSGTLPSGVTASSGASITFNLYGDVNIRAIFKGTPTSGCQQWGSWTITSPATCEAAGVETKTCTQQGTTTTADSTRTIPKLTGAQCPTDPGCTQGSNCDTDVGRCEVGTTCTNNVQRGNCTGTFSYGVTCQTTTPPLVGKFRDTRDDRDYDSVRIGTQVWMAENLNYAGTSGNVGVCYNNQSSNCDIYGRLYTWNEAMNNSFTSNNVPSGVRGVCPDGWHLPSDAEWDILINYVSTSSSNYPGQALKSQDGWNSCGPTGSGKSYLCADEFGFSALPGGIGWYGDFYNAGNNGGWWSATELDATVARFRHMFYYYVGVASSWDDKYGAFSVRCLRD